MPDANATATMDNSNGHGWRRWAMAVGAVLIACLARAVLWPDLFREATFMPLFGAVLLSAWYGGLGPGLLAVALVRRSWRGPSSRRSRISPSPIREASWEWRFTSRLVRVSALRATRCMSRDDASAWCRPRCTRSNCAKR